MFPTVATYINISTRELPQVATDCDSVLLGAVVRGRRNPLYLGLPARLKRARENLSFDSVATSAGLFDGSTVFLLERKPGHVPRIDIVERIAAALGLSPAFLGYGIAVEPTPHTDKLRSLGVAARLREARQARGLSVRVLATAAGVSHTAVGNVERGTMPGLDTAEALAVALGVSPAWLAYGLGPMELPSRRRKAAAATPEPDHDLTA
jgi:transcriptional regulator with XRE-family HTH domain